MNTMQNTDRNPMDLLTAGEIEQMLKEIDREIARSPNVDPIALAVYGEAVKAHILAWRGRE